MSSVVVVGCGRVGACFVSVLSERFDVFVADQRPAVVASLVAGEWPHRHAESGFKLHRPVLAYSGEPVDYAVIVVDTPSLPDGRFDDSKVLDAIKQVQAETVVVVSTLSPGTKLPYDVAYCPTMIRLGSVIADLEDAKYQFIGGNPAAAKLFYGYPVYLTVEQTLQAKLLVNCYLALKISFANAIGDPAVARAVGTDPRIGRAYLNPGEPYGGPCLPRDVDALAAHGGFEHFVTACRETNAAVVRKLCEKAPEVDCAVYRLKVTSMGYKPGCDEPHGLTLAQMVKEELARKFKRPVVLVVADEHWLCDTRMR